MKAGSLLVAAALAALAGAQDPAGGAQQSGSKQLSWKERAKLEYQKRYEKYILHKKPADDSENAIGGSLTGADIGQPPVLDSRLGNLPAPPPPPPPRQTTEAPTTQRRTTTPRPTTPRPTTPRPTTPRPTTPRPTTPRPTTPRPTTPFFPPTTTTSRSTTAFFRPMTTTTTFRPTTTFFRPTTTTTFRPTTTFFRPTTTTTFRPPQTTRPTSPPLVFRPTTTTSRSFVAPFRPPVPITTTRRPPLPLGFSEPERPAVRTGTRLNSNALPEQNSASGTFQSPPGTFGNTRGSGGGFASSSATAFSSGGGSTGGFSSSNAGIFNSAGASTGTFSFSSGEGSSSSGSTFGASGGSSGTATAVRKSPVALIGQVVQGFVRPITSILPAPLGPRGSNPGIVGGLVSGIFDELDGSLRAIYPGTLWCGAGNVARSEDEVGVFRSTDRCCRRHDNCPDSIAAGALRHGLKNTGTFTRSHCDCDEAFYDCLKQDRGSLVSVKVGTTYFNLLRPRCFREVNTCGVGKRAAAAASEKNCISSYRWFNNRLF